MFDSPSVEVLRECGRRLEACFRKAWDTNTLVLSASPLLHPVSHAYEQQDARCLHLLQAVALVPSCKSRKLLGTVRQALKMPLVSKTRSQLETSLCPLLKKLQEEDQKSGFMLRKEHVVNGMRLGDLVAIPSGAGCLRGYGCDDGFCTVVYPWGHGFVHVKDVEKIERLPENLSLQVPVERDSAKETSAAALEEVGLEVYKELLKSLEEEHVDTTVLREDLGFWRRVLALTKKAKLTSNILKNRSSKKKQEQEKKPVGTEVQGLLSETKEEEETEQYVLSEFMAGQLGLPLTKRTKNASCCSAIEPWVLTLCGVRKYCGFAGDLEASYKMPSTESPTP
ncbi:uncharacterized protein KRP23_14995 [Phytophthora ramorum]|uniref:uncharacterized protein n=1 Tax=Phytophthora ramorum TaxID=164328 RepID=UPI0030ADDAA5|nr:hypothetical protein KRP23_14995 [Phytophthora ramorum]